MRVQIDLHKPRHNDLTLLMDNAEELPGRLALFLS